MPWQAALQRAALVWVAALPWVVQAQQVDLLPSAVSQCLQPPAAQRGLPDYPFLAWKTGEKGRVKVELEFTTPTGRPKVRVLESEGPDTLLEAVREHVRTWRVPCLTEAEGSARLVMDFVFTADSRRVQWSRPRDALGAEQAAMLRCVVHTSGRKFPEYPENAVRDELQGRVLARLRFVAPDQPPQAEVFARPKAAMLARTIEAWVAGVRMPCHTGGPVEALYNFAFRFEESAYGFKPLDLLQLMAATRDIGKQTLVMDTREMGCPFDLQFHYYQPFSFNRVGEMGASNPARQPLLDWLEGIQLALPARTEDTVFGDSTTVSVPCIKIDLKPQEQK